MRIVEKIRAFILKWPRRIVGSVLLIIIYILGIGPASLIAKVAGKRFIETRLDKQAASYWRDAEAADNFHRQF